MTFGKKKIGLGKKKTAKNKSGTDKRHTTVPVASNQKVPLGGHRFAEIFPRMGDDALYDLARDIKKNGLREKIVMFEAKILDGRCRERACQLAEVKPRYKEYDGSDPLAYVVSKNLHRRQLNDSQRAMVAARLADLKVGDNQHTTEGVPVGAASKLLNVKERSTARAKEVLRGGVPEVADAVASGKMAISKAAKLSRLPASKQRESLASSDAPSHKRSPKPKAANPKASSKFESLAALADECLALLTPLDPKKPKGYFAGIKSVWDKAGLAAAWKKAPKEVRNRFVHEVLS